MKEFEIAKKIGKELTESELKEAAAKALGVKPEKVGAVVVVRRSVDARQDILYRYRVQAYREGEAYEPYKLPDYQDVHDADPVVVIGAGPAGLFAALKLLTRGLKPVILERGKDVHRRKADMAKLSVEGVVDPDSNYCYGEGGAGAFSDGKLFTRSSKRGDIREVLHQFVRFGADPSILIDAHPHLGTDKLPGIVENIRLCIEEHGGEYHFDSRVTDIVPVAGGFEVHVGETVYKAAKVCTRPRKSSSRQAIPPATSTRSSRAGAGRWRPRVSPWASASSTRSGSSTKSAITASTSPSCLRPNTPSSSRWKTEASSRSACVPAASWSPPPPRTEPWS